MYELYANPEIEALQQEIVQKRMKIIELLKANPTALTKNYKFMDSQNLPIGIGDLFGDKKDLIVIHNMGKSCRYCTLWADGINGVEHHLTNKAAFVVVSPDTPEVQKEFAASRGWKFTMLSDKDREFSLDMGFGKMREGKFYAQPGYSTFQKQDDGTIKRIGYDEFGPGDMYSGIWHVFDLLGEGAGDWEPQYTY
ncbi:MAG TPA: DUF899 family protein [Candidatus Kapabacteria bacterium]